jgi:hypothetical protein
MRTCEVVESDAVCGEPHIARGMCNLHYRRWKKYGDPSITKYNRGHHGVCSDPECQEPYRAKGFCDMHYQRWVKHGDPSVSLCDQSNRGTDNVGYTAAHIRIYQVKGKASQHQCVDCGDRADHWSYNHQDPDEKDHLVKGIWIPYSINMDFYEPRCVACHNQFDRDILNNQPVTQEVT